MQAARANQREYCSKRPANDRALHRFVPLCCFSGALLLLWAYRLFFFTLQLDRHLRRHEREHAQQRLLSTLAHIGVRRLD